MRLKKGKLVSSPYVPSGAGEWTHEAAYAHDCSRNHKQGLRGSEVLKRPKRRYVTGQARLGVDCQRLTGYKEVVAKLQAKRQSKPAGYGELVALKRVFS